MFQGPDEVTVGQTFTVEAEMDNPLPMALTKCEWAVSAPKTRIIDISGNDTIEANGKGKVTAKLVAMRPGVRQVIINLISENMDDIDGGLQVKASKE